MKILPLHTEALRYFGYTEEEARFLYLVATHSGYFTRDGRPVPKMACRRDHREHRAL